MFYTKHLIDCPVKRTFCFVPLFILGGRSTTVYLQTFKKDTRNARNAVNHIRHHTKKKTQNAVTYKASKMYNTINKQTKKLKNVKT